MFRRKLVMRRSLEDRLLHLVSLAFVFAFSLICLAPFVVIFSASVSGETYLRFHGYDLLPHDFSLQSYAYIFSSSSAIGNAYLVSGFVTSLGTVLSMLVTGMLAYAISRNNMKYRRALNAFVYFTMIFSGGLVPWYIIVTKYLHLYNSILCLVIPYTINVFNFFLLKQYLASVDASLLESARIDGMGEFSILARIVLPLALPGIATVALFYALQYWNDWWLALLLINDRELFPLQFLLRMIISSIEYASSGSIGSSYAASSIPGESLKMATTIVTIGPMVFVFPLVQRFFIKGLMTGGVKG